MANPTAPALSIGFDASRLGCDRRRPPATTTSILACAAGLLAACPTAAPAGTTLLSRHSTITATGVPGDAAPDAEVDDTFGRFAGQVGTGDAAVDGVVCIAQQYSVPGVLGTSGAGLEAAFGEGQVRAGVTGSPGTSPAGTAAARSGIELLFQVEGRPTTFAIGAAMGATGGAAVGIELTPVQDGRPADAVFSVAAAGKDAGPQGQGRAVEDDVFLEPGRYLLRVHADAVDPAGEEPGGSAYYNFNVRMTDAPDGWAGGPPAAVPLPPAVLGGGGMLGLLALRRLAGRRRAA